MANYTVAAGALAVHEKVLAANAVDTVTFADDVDSVEILHLDGTGRVYFTVDGSAPAVAGATSRVLLPGSAIIVGVPTSGATVVKLVSAGSATYSVTAQR